MIIHDIVKNPQKVSMPKKTEIPYKTNKWIFQHVRKKYIPASFFHTLEKKIGSTGTHVRIYFWISSQIVMSYSK